MEKKKVLKAIELLPKYRYSCHVLKQIGVNNNTLELYQQFLISHYPMFFTSHKSLGLVYVEILDKDLFEPSESSIDIRTIFLKQFSKYL